MRFYFEKKSLNCLIKTGKPKTNEKPLKSEAEKKPMGFRNAIA